MRCGSRRLIRLNWFRSFQFTRLSCRRAPSWALNTKNRRASAKRKNSCCTILWRQRQGNCGLRHLYLRARRQSKDRRLLFLPRSRWPPRVSLRSRRCESRAAFQAETWRRGTPLLFARLVLQRGSQARARSAARQNARLPPAQQPFAVNL